MNAYLTLPDIESRQDELTAELEVIFEQAKEEDRDLTDDEVGRVNEIQGEDGAGGELAKLDSRHVMIKAKNERIAQKLKDRGKPIIERSEHSDQPGEDPLNRVVVPARARASRKLQYFDDERSAYVAGQWILAAIFGSAPAENWCKDRGFWNVQSEGTATKGGFLVPEEMQRTMVRLREEHGVFPRFARPYPMGSDRVFVPRPLADVTAYWVGENTEVTESDLSLGGAKLTAEKIAALVKESTEIDEDSVVDIGEMITNSMAFAMAKKIDEAGFNGDGTSTYGGITGLANALTDADPATGGNGAVVNAASGNDAANNLDLLDFESVVGQLPEYDMGGEPRWYMSKPVYVASYVRLMNALGGVVRSEISGDRQPEIMGYPVTFVHVMPKTISTLASTIIAYFGWLDLAATYGRRRSVRTVVSTERYLEFDQIGILTTERVGITVHERGDDINQRPILALKTAA